MIDHLTCYGYTLCPSNERSVTEAVMTEEANDRSEHARIAALTRAAQSDGSAMTAPARAAFLDGFKTGHKCKYCKPITIDQSLPPEQRARATQALISLHFTRIRKARKKAAQASKADRELAGDLAQLDVQ
jgi:hypothetical protein